MWLDKYRVPRRAVLAWACWLITVTVLTYLDNMGEVETVDGVIIGAIVGILSIVIGYQKIDTDNS